jgi:hypothetical protein
MVCKFWYQHISFYHPEAHNMFIRGQFKCDGTRTETRFRLSAKRTSPLKSAGVFVQSTAGSRGVRISSSNSGYAIFRGSEKGTGYPLHSLVSPPVRHRVPLHFNWSLQANEISTHTYIYIITLKLSHISYQ